METFSAGEGFMACDFAAVGEDGVCGGFEVVGVEDDEGSTGWRGFIDFTKSAAETGAQDFEIASLVFASPFFECPAESVGVEMAYLIEVGGDQLDIINTQDFIGHICLLALFLFVESCWFRQGITVCLRVRAGLCIWI